MSCAAKPCVRRLSWGPVFPLLAALVLADPLAASSEWVWTGNAWADYRAFMSPITASVKGHLQTIRADGVTQGRVEGRMGQIGDSITHASPYFRNVVLDGPFGNQTGYGYAGVRSWLAYSGAMPANPFSFYRDHGKEIVYGNFSGWTVDDAVAAGHPGAAVDVGDGVTPGDFSWALLMFGTNDIDDPLWDAAAWALDYADFVRDFIDLGVIPVLSTIPPEEAHLADGRVEEANLAIRAMADEMKIPYVDFYELIFHYQPVDWLGTLISLDGTHPSAGGGGWDFSQNGLTTTDGYAARSKLTLDFAAKLEAIVFENGLPEPAPGELFADDFETGDAAGWSKAFPPGAVAVTAAAAFSGALGLAATLDACSPRDLVVGPPPSVTGDFTACEHLDASEIEVAAPGATFTAGIEIAIGDGFRVASGAELTAGNVGELAEPFAYLEDDTPDDLLSYGAVFRADLDGLSLVAGDEVDLFAGYSEDGSPLFRLTLEYDAGLDQKRLVLSAWLDDETFARTPVGEELALPSGYRLLEVSWRAGDGDGELVVAIDSSPPSGLAGLANGQGRLEEVRLGLVDGVVGGSAGTLHVDEFQSFL